MKDWIDFLLENKEWLFSGIGIVIITAVIAIIRKKKPISKTGNTVVEIETKFQSDNVAGEKVTNISIKGGINIDN